MSLRDLGLLSAGLLLAACVTPAHATPAHATTACSARLTLPSGERLWVYGWGDSREQARASAERAARFLGRRAAELPLLELALWEDDAALRAEAATWGARGVAGVPGARIHQGPCHDEALPTGLVSARWSGGPRVERQSAALATDAARRETCVEAYVRGRMDALNAAVETPDRAAFHAKALASWEALRGCYGAQEVLVRQEGLADLEPTETQCVASTATDPRQAIGVGLGANAAIAAEDALYERTDNLLRMAHIAALKPTLAVPRPSPLAQRGIAWARGAFEAVAADDKQVAALQCTPLDGAETGRSIAKARASCAAAPSLAAAHAGELGVAHLAEALSSEVRCRASLRWDDEAPVAR